MEIKEVIHFYLGCDVMTEQGKGRLSEVHANGDMIVEADNDVDYYEWVKPILRRLSDMTEDEMKEFKKLIPHIDFVRFERGDKWVYIEHEMDDKHTTRPVCTTTALIGGMPMSVMPYLLKQGFDLFGLIDAGLAIDNKSL